MDTLGLLARVAVAAVALSAVGAVVSLASGLLATPSVLVQSLVALVLVAAVVGWLTRVGIRRSGGTETTYW